MNSQLTSAKEIFLNAAELFGAQRREYVDAVCGGDATLYREVEDLLRHHEQMGEFLQAPMPTTMVAGNTRGGESPGTMIGPYELLEPIGEGGMGAVWMAQQTEPVKRVVALKLIKAGMDSKQVIARFEAERQALAMMDHVNIARVLDAGATDAGRPYFVMDLVQGVPITKSCDENRLTPRQRLELFIPVCHAIQHAHQKGVIHRDLKPSNVLVAVYDGKPVPKVIDFGLAKATGPQLTEGTLITGVGNIVGTLEYMSPEQAEINPLDIDTRSDIYSLGVLLYELLAGSPPFTRKELGNGGVLEILRMIREQEPLKPSTKLSSAEGLPTLAANRGTEPARLTKLVRGELDWIVMKALEKDRNRRYATASDFADDVQRHLNDEPVQACPPSPLYKFRKFARRHLHALATGSFVGIALLATVVVLAVSNFRIDQALNDRTSALTQRNQAFGELQDQQKKTTTALQEKIKLLDDVKQEQKQTRQALYFHSVGLADREWGLNHVDKAEEILEQCPVEFRDWEWSFLKRRCAIGAILTRFEDPPAALGFSPDGEHLACCMKGGYPKSKVTNWGLRIWETRTSKEVLHVKIPFTKISQFAFSPDGRQIALPSHDFETRRALVRILDARTGADVRRIVGDVQSYFTAVAYTVGGEELAIAGDNGVVKFVNLATGKERTLQRSYKGSTVLSFSPDGKRMATAGQSARVWDTNTGEELFQLEGHAGRVFCVDYSPDGNRLVTTSTDGWRTFEANIGKNLLTMPLVNEPEADASDLNADRNAVFSPDGEQILISAMDRTVRALSASSGNELYRHRGHHGVIRRVAWSRAGWQASLAADGTLRLWPPTRPPVVDARMRNMIVGLSPDGEIMALADRDPKTAKTTAITFRDVISGADKMRFSPPRNTTPYFAGMSRDNQVALMDCRQILGVGKTAISVQVCDLESGKEVAHIPFGANPYVNSALQGDNKRLATTTGSGITVWDLPTAKMVYSVATREPVGPVTYSPDDGHLAAIFSPFSKEHKVNLLDAKTGELKRTWTNPGRANSLAFSFNGEFLAVGSSDYGVRILQVLNEQPARVIGEPCSGVAFLAKSKRLLTWGGRDKAVRVWDVATGRELLRLGGNDAQVAHVAQNGAGVITTVNVLGFVRQFDGRQVVPEPAPAKN